MKCAKAVVMLSVLLVNLSFCGKKSEEDPWSRQFGPSAMHYADQEWGLVWDGAVKRGFADGVVGSMTSFFDTLLAPAIRKGGHVALICGKAVMHALNGDRGFNVSEPINYYHVIKRDMETVDNTGKAGRVVRAHVLEQDDAATALEVKKPHSVVILKQDVEYVVNALQKRLPYYEKQFDTKQGRISKALDWALIPAGACMVKGLVSGKTNGISKVSDLLKASESLTMHEGLHPQAVEQEVVRAKDLLERNLGVANNRLEHSIEASLKKDKEQAWVVYGKDLTQYKTRARLATSAYIVWRALAWMKSERSAALVAALSDVDRDMVVQLTKNVVGQLKHIIELCDEIKNDGDIVRLKDDLDFTAKNCGKGLLHLAQLIDQDEAFKLQRSEPGQAGAGLGQAPGGMGAGYSRF